MLAKKHFLMVVLLYILSGCLQAVMGQGDGSSQSVVWTNLVNTTATGNTLQKTSGCDGCADAGQPHSSPSPPAAATSSSLSQPSPGSGLRA
jgi:hypothetical protein